LGPKTDFGEWLSEIVGNQQTWVAESCDTYINILKVLFFTMFAQHDIVTNSDLLRHGKKMADIVGSPENIMFLTREQRNVLTDQSMKRVAFMSAFGTGKTTLLFQKAKQLVGENYKVLIVIINKAQDSPLMQKYQQLLNQDTTRICNVFTGTTYTHINFLACVSFTNSDNKLRCARGNFLSFHERSEWNGRKFTQKKILARPHRSRGMSSVCLSVCLSVRPSVRP
jgi:hypothetical protein